MKWYFSFWVCSALQFSAGGWLTAQCTFSSNVPFQESFTNITADNQLPTCWLSTNQGTNTLTFTNNINAFTGQHCGAFFHAPAGTNYFHSNAIQMYAGVTYSASLHYKTDNSGGTNWSDLSLLIGPGRSPANATLIAGTSTPNTATYLSLSGTFTVGGSGMYYLAIRGTAIQGPAEKLYIDNISVTIPCTGPGAANAPSVTISTSNGYTTTSGTSSICAGTQNTFVAMGAGSYTWAGGSNSATLVNNASFPGMLSVSGTNTLTGCISTASISSVHPVPNMTLSSAQKTVCPGETVVLNAVGAHTYSWSTGSNGATIAISPSATAIYTVSGTFTNTGCWSSAAVTVVVAPANVSVAANPSTLCQGASATLTAGGTFSYQWSGAGAPGSAATVVVTPTNTSSYTVVGMNSAACSATATVAVTVLPSPSLTISGSTIICIGETRQLIGAGAVSYQWTGSNLTPAGNTATINPAANTVYTLTGSGANGCSASTVFAVAVDECVGRVSDELAGISVYPNPFSHTLLLTGLPGSCHVTLCNAFGQLLFKDNITNGVINTQALPCGIYTLWIRSESQIIPVKLVKVQ